MITWANFNKEQKVLVGIHHNFCCITSTINRLLYITIESSESDSEIEESIDSSNKFITSGLICLVDLLGRSFSIILRISGSE